MILPVMLKRSGRRPKGRSIRPTHLVQSLRIYTIVLTESSRTVTHLGCSFGTDENALNRIFCLRVSTPCAQQKLNLQESANSSTDCLMFQTAAQIQVLTEAYKSRYGKNVIDILRKETSGYYEKTLCTIALGPLEGDVQLLHDAIAGAGTKESMVTEILVGRREWFLPVCRSYTSGGRLRNLFLIRQTHMSWYFSATHLQNGTTTNRSIKKFWMTCHSRRKMPLLLFCKVAGLIMVKYSPS